MLHFDVRALSLPQQEVDDALGRLEVLQVLGPHHQEVERAQRLHVAAEARGLGWLDEANVLRIPKVVAVSQADDMQQFLVLELIAPAPPARDFDERLGRGVAAADRRHELDRRIEKVSPPNGWVVLQKITTECAVTQDLFASRSAKLS